VEIVSLDLSDNGIATELLALQRRAYEVEATLIGSREIPPLEETLDELQGSREIFLGAVVEGRIVGAVSYRLLGHTIDLHRLVVDPARFRGGIGITLVQAALAAEPSAARAMVQTGADNEPAKSLYRREGFEQDRGARGCSRPSYRSFQHATQLTHSAPRNDATVTPRGRAGRSSSHVHCAGSLSSRKRMSLVPWRKRFDCTLS